jgi:hypothetical protein
MPALIYYGVGTDDVFDDYNNLNVIRDVNNYTLTNDIDRCEP